MKYRAWIINNETGEGRWYDMGDCEPRYMETQEFWWSEGNAACDCNRKIFWGRAIGHEYEDDETPCGDTGFSVPYIEWEDGRREYIDGEESVSDKGR